MAGRIIENFQFFCYNVFMGVDTKFLPYLEKINAVLERALPAAADVDFTAASFALTDEKKDDFFEKARDGVNELLAPDRELLMSGGKRWRPVFLLLCAQALSYKNGVSDAEMEAVFERAASLTPLVEFVHTASLIHDDIEDGSQERRGKKAAYLTYGLDTALNSASWLYFEAALCIKKSCLEDLRPALYEAYLGEVRKLHLGQAMDIFWHNKNEYIPGRQEYLVMVKNKTGTLSSLSARIAALLCACSQKEENLLADWAASIGAAFQIIDDVINLTSGNPGKKRGDDIVEGKKSLPVILFFEEASTEEKGQLLECLKKAHGTNTDNPCVEEAILLLQRHNSVEKARALGLKLIEECLSEYENLLGKENPYMKKIKSLFLSMSPKS